MSRLGRGGWQGLRLLSLGLVGIVWALGGATRAANSGGEDPSREGASVLRTATTSLHGARWMAMDPRTGGILVLASANEREDAGLRLMLLRSDGRLKRTYQLPTGNPEAEAHLFPRSGKVAITADVTSKVANRAMGQAGQTLNGKRVWLMDLGSGKFQSLASAATAFSADPGRDRLYVARGRNFRVIDVARGSNVASRLLDSTIESVAIDTMGRVHLLHSALVGAGAGFEPLAVLTPPEYRADPFLAEPSGWMAPPVLLAMAQTEVPMGVAPQVLDEEDDASSDEEMEADDEDESDTPVSESAKVFGPAPGAESILVHEEDSGKLSIYDATTHALLNEQRDFYGQIVAFDSNGRALVVSGKRLERRDARSFELLQSIEVGGFINLATFDSTSNCVFAIVEAWKGDRWQDELVRLELNRLGPVL